ncbi:putative spermidine/putrescine transport system substrate-binding protein [Paenibacillus sp. DS2015]|uniref:ABC transporter substrate-binding protein n=1 Tax=Paenibacillus sp. DS2015 TaxID=3373917 RepID=UPI003D22D5B3
MFKMNQGKSLLTVLSLVLAMSLLLAACGDSNEKPNQDAAKGNDEEQVMLTLEELVPLAQAEGKVISVGMPDAWANWKDTWTDLKSNYGLEHSDTDMGSVDEINKFDAEKKNPSADIGDVGISFGPMAVQKGVTQPYKTEYWDEVPDWAKDEDGHWMVAYTGSISLICNKDLVDKCPTSWQDVENNNGAYKIALGDVSGAAQAQHAILAAAIAFGGDEGNIQPGIEYFKRLAEKDLISKVDVTIPNFQKGEVAVAAMWDFNSLAFREEIGKDKFEIVIPKDGSVISGYASIINKYAPHPNAAKLARAYIFSDEGQINLAKGFARPIRTSVVLPKEVEENLIPLDQYETVKPIGDFSVWENTVKGISALWQEEVQVHIK